MDKVSLSLALIISGLTLGYIIQNPDRRGSISLPIQIVELRKPLQKMGLLFASLLRKPNRDKTVFYCCRSR